MNQLTSRLLPMTALVSFGLLTASSAFSDTLGSVIQISSAPCTSGLPGTCYQLQITGCPEASDLDVSVKVTSPPGTVSGAVLFLSGGGSSGYYESNFTYGTNVVSQVVQGGFYGIQIAFSGSTGYLTGPSADGPRSLACRVATLADQWAYPKLAGAGKTTGFCATGNSGGGSGIAYSLSQYGLGSIFDMVEVTSGPPMGRIDIGCLCKSGSVRTAPCGTTNGTCYGSNAGMFIDPAYGNSDCSDHLASQTSLWQHDSIASPDAVLAFPETDIHVVYGGQDDGSAVPLGLDWVNMITGLNGSAPSIKCVMDAPHPIANAMDGAAQIANDLKKYCVAHH